MKIHTSQYWLLLPAICAAGGTAIIVQAQGSAEVLHGKGRGASVQRPQYRVVDVGTLRGGGAFIASGINNNGEVVGLAVTKSTTHAVIWRKGRVTDIGAATRREHSEAGAINDKGHVLCVSDFDGSRRRVFLWSEGKRTTLGRPKEFAEYGFAVNASDQCVGQVRVGKDALHACKWVGSKTIDLGTLGGKNSMALGINARGDIAGSAETATGASHATLWKDEKPRDLGTLGGRSSTAYDINDQGVIAGESVDSKGHTRAFIWKNGKMSALPIPSGFVESSANAINDSGTVVGRLGSSYPDGRAVAWRNGVMFNLNACIPSIARWQLFEARGINDRGQIVGSGLHIGISKTERAFVLTPR